jgi:MFS family permease
VLLSLFSFRPNILSAKSQITGLPFARWRASAAVRRVTLARFVLEFFYTFMVIYTPIYLNRYVGFGWPELGVMFAIMLLPFVIIEWPAGEAADRWYGEKEMMGLGFIIAAGTLLLMPFLGKVFLLWTIALFISRIGASLIEVSTESYFFKNVEARDAGLISIFRLTRPVSVIIASIIGTVSLGLFSYGKIFWVLAFFTVLGLAQSLCLKDTK